MARRSIFVTFFLLICVGCSSEEKPSVIIIGAGSAGIAAATKLLENGITNITILEAEDRIGGRIHSLQFANYIVDVGAHFCYAEEGNVVYDLVKDLDVLQKLELMEPINIYNSTGVQAPKDFSKDFLNIVYDDYNDIESSNSSLKVAVERKYNATVLEKYKSDTEKLKLATDGIDTVDRLIEIRKGSFSLETVSGRSHSKISNSDQLAVWKTGGYHTILEVLMKKFPDSSKQLPIDDKIILNRKVNKIVWNKNKPVVETSDKSELTADYVIFTPSIGVLKKDKDNLFEPSLPGEKNVALDALGMDGIGKVYLHFSKEWWKEEKFMFLWNKEDLDNIKNEFPEGPNKNGISWITSLASLDAVANHPGLLLGWLSGDLVPEIEKTSDDVIQRGVMYAIRKFLGKTHNVTEPDQILKTRWITNPNFLGTYTFEKVGYYQEELLYQNVLGKPLLHDGKPSVLFAGEATHPTYFAAVDGAIESGQREAQRIIDIHQ